MRRRIKPTASLILSLFLFPLWADNELGIRYSLDLTFLPKSAGQVARVEGTNLITIANRWDRSLNEIYLHNNSNGYFDPDDEKSHRTVVGDIRCERLGVVTDKDEISMKIELNPALPPGDSVDIEVPFRSIISPNGNPFAPTVGTSGDTTIYNLIFFYPVLEYFHPDGWHVEHHSGAADPYSNLAEYHVTITFPAGYQVATSAHFLQADSLDTGQIRRTVHYPRAISFSMVIANNLIRRYADIQGIEVEVLHTSGQSKNVDTLLATLEELVPYYEARFGPCPNDKLTITMGYSLGENTGALATTNYIIYQGSMGSISTLAHEFGHQWFGGSIINDESYETWLAESFAEYAARHYMISKKGGQMAARDHRTFDFWSDIRDMTSERLYWWMLDIIGEEGRQPVHRPGHKIDWEKLDDITAIMAEALNVYYIGSNALQMLESAVGDSMMAEILLTYNREYAWRTVTTDTFITLVGRMAGEDIGDNFRQAIMTSKRPDLKITRVAREKGEDGGWTTRIHTDYHGDWLLPVDLQVITSRGDTSRFTQVWLDGRREFSLSTSDPVVAVQLDPAGRMFDYNRSNNRWPRRLQIQPLIGLPSWDVYRIYFRPRIKRDWRGDRRYGLQLTSVLGANLMPWLPTFFKHAFKLDIMVGPKRGGNRLGGTFSYRTPLPIRKLTYLELSASYEYPRNQQAVSLITYLGQPRYYLDGGRSRYLLLSTAVVRTELQAEPGDWWQTGSSFALIQHFTGYNHSLAGQSILHAAYVVGKPNTFKVDGMHGRFTVGADFEKYMTMRIFLRVWVEGGFVWDDRTTDELRFRLAELPQIWNEQVRGISRFRGTNDVEHTRWNNLVNGGFSAGFRKPSRINAKPIIYADWAIVDNARGTWFHRLGEISKAEQLYTAIGLGLESRSILHLGLYFPFWVSHPPGSEDNLRFRTMLQCSVNW
ncbi:MAG: hypothetical protein JSW54_11750 [Fidelibacterota bacterium]|nr:MAG: hypothetical protein JSW54_11750 [Candidatus Neomarinimicrobiota bacterium]